MTTFIVFSHDENKAIVRTQAGFNRFLKQWCNEKGISDMIGYLQVYPTIYPSVVSLRLGYGGYRFPIATCIPVGTYLKNIKSEEQLLLDTIIQSNNKN